MDEVLDVNSQPLLSLRQADLLHFEFVSIPEGKILLDFQFVSIPGLM